MNLTIKKAGTVLGVALCLAGCASPAPQTPKNPQDTMEEKLNLTDQWDKVFPQSDRVKEYKKDANKNNRNNDIRSIIFLKK